MADKLRCPLADCGQLVKDGTGYAAHTRAHVLRGEARYASDKTLIRIHEVPIVTEPYARKLRMKAIARGEIKAEISLPKSGKPSTALATVTPALSKKGRPPVNHNIDIDSLNETQIVQLVEEHNCTATRALDRMKDAIVLTSVAEMLEQPGASDQLLQMMAAMRGMPSARRK